MIRDFKDEWFASHPGGRARFDVRLLILDRAKPAELVLADKLAEMEAEMALVKRLFGQEVYA
jgi:hypothetical protein